MVCFKRYWMFFWLFHSMFLLWDSVIGHIRYSIPEELQTGAFVGNLAQDLRLDVKEISTRGLRIVSGSRQQNLEVNLDNGNLFVKEKIDREQLCGPSVACVLSFEAVLHNPLNLYHVEVEILDINDNAPSFPNSQLSLEIPEAAALGARFQLESAYDPDVGSNSLQSYRLVSNDFFTLDVQTRSRDEKVPVLVLEKPLDREKVPRHRLVLIAEDAGVPRRSGTVQITIVVEDANDNEPVFPESDITVSLSENAPQGTLVMTLNATDLDDGANGEIVYSFSPLTTAVVRELFGLDSQSGELRVKGSLDYEENNMFQINVQAKDRGINAIPTYCDVLVHIMDVNDNAPEVTLTSLSSPVREDALPGTVVALISVTDKDSGQNGQVQCEIEKDVPFKLDSSLKNYYRLLTRQPLDRENVSNYNVTITCRDKGSPPLVTNKIIEMEISDINDNAPRFLRSFYTAQVMENNLIGASVFSVTAFDADLNKNSRLSYSILESLVHGESVSLYVQINSNSGVIVAQRSFDFEQLKKFPFHVQAQDSGVPRLISNVSVDVIILDQNDNSPVIVSPLPEFGSTVTETVSRLAEPGYLVAKVSATDADTGQNGRLSYQILQATDPGLFTISPDTGEIWTIRSVRAKDANKQRLVIVVKDNGSPSLSATVTIVLSVVGGDAEMLSDSSGVLVDSGIPSDISLYLVVSLGITSTVFLVILIILAVKVHRNRDGFGAHFSLPTRCCFESTNSLNGIQKASRNIQIPPNYVEVFGGDPLSQRFRYGTGSSFNSTKRDFVFSNCRTDARSEAMGKDHRWQTTTGRNTINDEVRLFLGSLTDANGAIQI